MKHIFTNSNESAVVRNGYRCAKVARPLRTVFLIGTLLLTLGVGQMWADKGFEDSNNGVKFWRVPLGGSGADYRVEHGRTNSTQDAGDVSSLYLKEWYAKLYQNWDERDNIYGDGHMYYCVYLQGASAPSFTTSNKNYYNWNDWDSGWRRPTFGNNGLDINILSGKASGKYVFEYYYDATGSSTMYCSNNSNNFKINFNIKPAALTSFSVSRSGYSAGSGTSEDPYIIARGGSLTLTASGSGGTSDANSTIKYKYGSSDWQTTSYTISNITSTTKTSIVVKGARRHNSQDYGGDEKSVTIYYKAETTYSVTVTNGTPASVYAGANYTKPTITASGKTGYHFDHWSTTGGASVASTTTSPTTVTATATGTVTANYVPNEYSITLDDNGDYQGNGSATVLYGSNALTVSSHASRTGWNLVGYWTASGNGGSQVTDAAGHLIASVSGYTDGSGNWTKTTTPTTLYAHWNQINSLSVVAGSNISSVTGSTSPVTLNTKYAISATPNTGYSFSGWTADPAANGVFDDASSASTNVTVKNGSVTVTGAATENMTTVTVNVSPSGAGTLTLDAAAFTPGNTTTAGVATNHTIVATPTSGKVFHNWTVTGNATGSASTNTYTLEGNGNAGTGTLTANFGVASGWYMIGDNFGGWSTSPYPTSDQLTYPYRGMSGVYYIPVASLPTNKYWRVRTGSTQYNTSSSTTEDNTISKGTIYSLSPNTSKASKPSSALSDVWIVVNTGSSKKLWVQDPQTFYNVNVTNEGSGSKGTYKVTLKTTSAFTKGSNVFETTQFANGETFTVTVTGVTGYIPTITIGGNTTTFWKEADTYSADGTMSTSDIAVTISYTASYAVTFATTTGCGSLSATGPSSTAITTGTKVKSGTSITFTQSSSAGYDFQKWYSTSSGSGGTQWGTETSLTKSITAVTSVYPIYQTHTYTGGVLNKNGGSADGSYSVTYLATSFASKTAPTRTGYNVSGYYKEAAKTNQIADASGNLKASTDYTNSSKQWTYTSDIPTLYAKWSAKQYTITLDKKEGSANGSAKVKYAATALTNISAPTLTGYHVEGYYGETARTNKVADAEGNLQSGVTGFTNASSKWTKDGDATLYTNWTANTYTIAFDPNDDNYVGTATGTTASINATYGTSYSLTANGFSREGYTFSGWNTDPDGTSGTNYTNGQSVSNLTSTNVATVTLYAKWTGKTYTVSFNPRGGTCGTASKSVTMGATYGDLPAVTPPTGYVFDGWYTTADGGSKVESTTQVTSPNDHTLYAHYIQKAQVYFKNTLGWDNVYVTYDPYWNEDGNGGTNDLGTGNKGKIYHKMIQITGTDIYYDEIPEAALSPWKYNIAFNSQVLGDIGSSSNYNNFNAGDAVFRRDFDSNATMFVPTPNDPNKFLKNNTYGAAGTWYYSTDQWVDHKDSDPSKEIIDYRYKNGYWMKYNDYESGYVMKGTWDSESSDFYFHRPTTNGNSFTVHKELSANTDYYFRIYKHCNTNSYSSWFIYNNSATITSTDCTNLSLSTAIAKSETSKKDHIKTTVAGEYIFTITCKDDGTLMLSVEYPYAVNDYKVVYSYTKNGSHTFDSKIIRARANGLDTVSMFIHSGDSATNRSLKIYKCTGISNTGVATWNNNYATITLPSVTASGKTSGVYDFIISQNGSSVATGTYWQPYNGNYYIRTLCSDGGWDMYKYREDNKMTLSEYSMKQTLSAPYSHYYCHYLESTSTDITYTIATDYSPCICPILEGDATIGGVAVKTLPAYANVRFTWNQETNALKRAYLKSAQGGENTRYLVLHGKTSDMIFNEDESEIVADGGRSLAADELLFTDLGNWIYQVDLTAKPGAAVSLIADYNGHDRYLVGSNSSWETIIDGGTSSDKYGIIAVYDFKTNRLMTAWKPSGDIDENLTNVDILLIRHAQEEGTAITFGEATKVTSKEIIGAIEMRYNELVGHVANWTTTSRPLLKFFVSFPFDVNVSDIFGLNSAYGEAYIIEKYDGAERAAKGFFRGDGTTTFWKRLQHGDVMKANEGYCVILDNDYFNGDVGNIWQYKSTGSKVYLYFPSAGNVGDIEEDDQTITLPEHTCTIDRPFVSSDAGGQTVNHKNTDSHWNMMGVPVFVSNIGKAVAGTPGSVFATSGNPWDAGEGHFNYFYEWGADNNFTIHTAMDYAFKTMHGYMVQYHGDVTFEGTRPSAIVAARRVSQTENYQIELQVLNSNEEEINRAYIELRENACDTFALNEDVYMSTTNRAVDIFTFAGNYDVAANVLSINNHIVEVGANVRKAGMYTISMPSDFSGTVELVDSFNGERTNLALSNYEVYLDKGYTGRFTLEINVNKTPTAIDGVEGEGSLKDGKAHKFLQDGLMYILQNGVMYDAQGHRVK